MIQRSTALASPKQFDLVGLGVLLGFIAACAAYLGFQYLNKLQNRQKTSELLHGTIRLAATRNDIDALETLASALHFNADAALGGFTALHAACIQGATEAALWLCMKNANVHAFKDDGWKDTPLHYAAAHGAIDICKILLAFSADPCAVNVFGFAPSMVAQKRRHNEVATYLDAVCQGTTKMPTLDAICDIRTKLSHATSQARLASAAVDGTVEDSSNQTSRSSSLDLEMGKEIAHATAEQAKAWKKLTKRGYEGVGSEGTVLSPGTKVFRVLATLTQLTLIVYIFWRALRTLTPGWDYFYSIPIFLIELVFYPFSFIFILGLWYSIDRPKRWMGDMFPVEEFPHVDVYIVCYNETVDVLEPTIIAALNMNWPGNKLTVHVLDDGIGKPMHKLVQKLRYQLTCMNREARLVYVCRRKIPSVCHHAKAGNINHALLNSQGKGEFIVVLDADMIIHPDFLQKSLGHFYRQRENGWVKKSKVGFLQTPQDFYNIPQNDPVGHGARLFYGPLLSGRDGCGAAPCCGTGVVFCRDSLVSIGGQSYGSITEDYNTTMTFFGAGFASMFLKDRMVYGQAPEDITNVLSQRLRWSMGALQILYKSNPLKHPGLTARQSLLFYEAGAYHFMSIPMVIFMFVPLIYTYGQISPISANHLWELIATFGTYWICSRCMWLWISRSTYGGQLELWRSWQVFVWQSPNNVKAIWKVTMAEVGWLKRLTKKEIKFAVTDKKSGKDNEKVKESVTAKSIALAWPYLGYYIVVVFSVIYVIVMGALHYFSTVLVMANFCGLFWAFLNCWCMWPVISTILPRTETTTGWKIQWRAMLPFETMASLQGALSRAVSRMLSTPTRATGSRNNSKSYATLSARQSSMARSLSRTATAKSTPSDGTIQRTSSMRRANSLMRTVSSRSNIGRVAYPLRTAHSLQDSTLITSLVLPERGDFTSAGSMMPTMLALSDDGSMARIRGSSAESSFSVLLPQGSPIQQSSKAPTRTGSMKSETGPFSTVKDEQEEEPIEVPEYTYGISSVMRPPAWLQQTIKEDESLRGSKLSARVIDPQAALESAREHAIVVQAAIQKHLYSIEESDKEATHMQTKKDSENGMLSTTTTTTASMNPYASSNSHNDMLGRIFRGENVTKGLELGELDCLAHAKSIDAVLAATGTTSIQQFAAAQTEVFNLPSQEASSCSQEHVAAAMAADFASCMTVMESSMDMSAFVEQQEESFFSPFAGVADKPFHSSTSNGSLTPGKASSIEMDPRLPIKRAVSLSAAEARLENISHILIDVAESLTPAHSSKANRTTSMYIVPVIPASVFEHSIAATVSFDGCVAPSRSCTYIVVSALIYFGLVGLAIWDIYGFGGVYVNPNTFG